MFLSFSVIRQDFRSSTRAINVRRGAARQKRSFESNRKSSSRSVTSFANVINSCCCCWTVRPSLLVEMRDVLTSVSRVKAAYEESRDSRSLRHKDKMLSVEKTCKTLKTFKGFEKSSRCANLHRKPRDASHVCSRVRFHRAMIFLRAVQN